MAGRLVDVSGKSGQTHFADQIQAAWSSALADVPRHLASNPQLSEQFARQLAVAATKPQHATVLFALVDDAGRDTIVGEFFQNAAMEQLGELAKGSADLLQLLGRVSQAHHAGDLPAGEHNPVIEFGLASIAVPEGPAAVGSAVVTQTHVFPGAWEGPDSPGVLRDLVRIHEALTRNSPRKPLDRAGQPQVELWLASQSLEGSSSAAPPPIETASESKTEAKPPAQPEAKVPQRKAEPDGETKPEPPKPEARTEAKPAARPEPKPESKPAPQAESRRTNPLPPALPREESSISSPYAAEPVPGPNRTLLFAGIGVIVLGLAGAGYLLLSGGSKKPVIAPPVTSSAPSSTPAPAGQSTPAPVADSPTAPKPSPVPEASAASAQTAAKASTPARSAPAPTATTPATPIATAPAPAPAPQTAPPPAAPSGPDAAARRAAALDALNGADTEGKRRDARKALTGE